MQGTQDSRAAERRGFGVWDNSPDYRFRWRHDVRVFQHPGVGMVAARGGSYVRIEGNVAAELLLRLQHPHTLAEVEASFSDALDLALGLYELQRLTDLGLVEACKDGDPQRGAATGKDEAELPAAFVDIAGRRIHVLASPYHYLDGYIEERLRTPEGLEWWLPTSVVDGVFWLGPLFGSNAPPCWECLAHRLWHNHPIESFLHSEGWERETLWKPSHSAGGSAHADWVEDQIGRLCSSPDGVLELTGTLLRWNPDLQCATRHRVGPRPQCPRCGDPSLMKHQLTRPPKLSDSRSVKSTDGGLRICDPQDTLKELESLVDPLTGLVSSLGPLPDRHDASGAVFAASYYSRPAPGEATKQERFDQTSAGKGNTPLQAKASALCEALERICARHHGDEPALRGSVESLQPEAIEPQALLLFSDSQYRRGTPKEELANSSVRSQAVPRPLDTKQPLDWLPVWSLVSGARRLVPAAYCLAGIERAAEERVCSWDSNGCAAGNCLDEAVLQGLLELVERDAVAIWWYNRVLRPAYDLHASLGEAAQRRLAGLSDGSREIWALDLTHDLGIPVIAAVARQQSNGAGCIGLGCHIDPTIAAERAVQELGQILDGRRAQPPLWSWTEIEEPEYLLPHEDAASVGRVPTGPKGSAAPHQLGLGPQLQYCLSCMSEVGLEPLVFNYSRPDVPLKTVKTVVPGMRHVWPRYAPGRLYDVPVQLGWRTSALDEDALNPMPLLL